MNYPPYYDPWLMSTQVLVQQGMDKRTRAIHDDTRGISGGMKNILVR